MLEGGSGRCVHCQCWELKNAKSFPYVKEILKSRQHFLSLFIDNKDREKIGGGSETLEYFSFAFSNTKPSQMALIREIPQQWSPRNPLSDN